MAVFKKTKQTETLHQQCRDCILVRGTWPASWDQKPTGCYNEPTTQWSEVLSIGWSTVSCRSLNRIFWVHYFWGPTTGISRRWPPVLKYGCFLGSRRRRSEVQIELRFKMSFKTGPSNPSLKDLPTWLSSPDAIGAGYPHQLIEVRSVGGSWCLEENPTSCAAETRVERPYQAPSIGYRSNYQWRVCNIKRKSFVHSSLTNPVFFFTTLEHRISVSISVLDTLCFSIFALGGGAIREG